MKKTILILMMLLLSCISVMGAEGDFLRNTNLTYHIAGSSSQYHLDNLDGSGLYWDGTYYYRVNFAEGSPFVIQTSPDGYPTGNYFVIPNVNGVSAGSSGFYMNDKHYIGDVYSQDVWVYDNSGNNIENITMENGGNNCMAGNGVDSLYRADETDIQEYNLSGITTGFAFDISSQMPDGGCEGMAIVENGDFLILQLNDLGGDTWRSNIYRYNSSGDYLEINVSVPIYLIGLTWNGTEGVFQALSSHYNQQGIYTYDYSGNRIDRIPITHDNQHYGLTVKDDYFYITARWQDMITWGIDDIDGDGLFEFLGHKYVDDIFSDEEDIEPRGIFWDGSYFWMTTSNTNTVYQLDENLISTGVNHTLGQTLRGLAIAEGDYYVASGDAGIIGVYDSSWNYLSNFSVASYTTRTGCYDGDENIMDLVYVSPYLYTTGWCANETKILNLSGDLIGSYPNTKMIDYGYSAYSTYTGITYLDDELVTLSYFARDLYFAEGFPVEEEPEPEPEPVTPSITGYGIYDTLSETGLGIGRMVDTLRLPVGQFILFMAIIGGVVSLILGIVYAIRKLAGKHL